MARLSFLFNYIHFTTFSQKSKWVLSALFLFMALIVNGQDIHFSQFIQSPLNLNPAETGNFKGAYRFVGNFRRQWSSVTIPYQTFGLSADARDFKRVKNMGLGANFYYDRAGDSHFSTLVFNLSASYRIPLNKAKTHYFIIGAQGGITQRKIDYSNLTFDNQYNGSIYDPNTPSIESFANTGRVYPNLNAGINYTKQFEKRKSISTGIALFNITRPQQSFFDNNSITLDRRWNFNISGQYKLSEKIDLLPATQFMAQGTYKNFIVGTSVKYILNDRNQIYRAVRAGGWVRVRDATFISIGMDYDQWFVGLSYDINYSNLKPASSYKGGFELSAIYIVPELLPKRLKYKVCPEFL